MMAAPIQSGTRADADGNPLGSSPADWLQLWQHFTSTAGEDKNRMIQITSWLLGVSAGIIALQLTGQVAGDNKYVLFAFGIAVSIFAIYIVSLYWLHEKWNRSKADETVKNHPALNTILASRSRPMGGRWVFGFFLALTFLSLIAHVIVVTRSTAKPAA